jgi:hypothetical protein
MWSYGKGKSMKCGLMEKENQGNVVFVSCCNLRNEATFFSSLPPPASRSQLLASHIRANQHVPMQSGILVLNECALK